jgi:hypothetical protein
MFVTRDTAVLSKKIIGFLVCFSICDPTVLLAQEFIGSGKCESCHPFAFERWKQGPHYAAHLSLRKEQLDDSKCNSCHTMPPRVNLNNFMGIQCESCHGAGQYYFQSYVMKDKELARAVGLTSILPENCLKCHNATAPSVEAFEYDSAWARIGHGMDARMRWEKARARSSDNSQ